MRGEVGFTTKARQDLAHEQSISKKHEEVKSGRRGGRARAAQGDWVDDLS